MKFSPITPFEPISTDEWPSGEQWVSQVKWDGVRILVYYDGKEVNIFNRRHNNRILQYPELADVHAYCNGGSFILDGEVIALDEGKPSFHKVMKRDRIRKSDRVALAQKEVPITYMIFDILYYNGEWITNKPLEERQHILTDIITVSDTVQVVKNHSHPEDLYQVVTKHDLEGIVMKDMRGTYTIGGKDKRWQKRKVFKDLVAVVGGVTFRSKQVNALLLGLYDEQERLQYIGHAGTGKLTQHDWKNITKTAEALQIETQPFVNTPERSKDAMWVQPELTVKINFIEWTKSHTLRQPSIQSIVKADPKSCTFEQN
ncbi:RNA ligase family protein [Caldalkalibacillus salinus]|uniref:ATP-dependent DNA ligase n=1 Tax=Caldalkalibacillus salinus TaxID=2803787 RepID=UPI00192314E2|nr:RNA ligase family protein [Caldalkalibacillus salinus]